MVTDCVEIISLLLCFPLKILCPATGKKAADDIDKTVNEHMTVHL